MTETATMYVQIHCHADACSESKQKAVTIQDADRYKTVGDVIEGAAFDLLEDDTHPEAWTLRYGMDGIARYTCHRHDT